MHRQWVTLFAAFADCERMALASEVCGRYGRTVDCGPQNTGYVGPKLSAVAAVLENGNIRETWALMYVLSKTGYFNELLVELLSPAHSASPRATPASLAAQFGMDGTEVAARWSLVNTTLTALDPSRRYDQGVPVFDFPSLDSWVRFDFRARGHSGELLWEAAREFRASGCGTVSMRSDDPSIQPPLSAAELAYQCGDAAPPCALRPDENMQAL